jgi:hypothetical protein
LRTDVANDSIDKATYLAWFKWEAGAESNVDCFKDPTYALVDANGDSTPATDELIKINGQGDIEITNEKLTSDSIVV